MALIIRGRSECPICTHVIKEKDEIVATSSFVDSDHPLWSFSDAAMHQSCFMTWALRPQFVSEFNAVHAENTSPSLLVMHPDGSLEQVINPALESLATAQLEQLEEDRVARSRESEQAATKWAGEPRECNRCSTVFESVQDKGTCPKCHHVFYASEPPLT